MSKPYSNVEAHAESASSSTTQLPDQIESTIIYHGSQKSEPPAPKSSESILAAKGLLVTQALDEIGWTTFHLKLFCFSGLGTGTTNMATMLQSVVAHQALTEFGSRGYPTALTIAFYTGQLFGSLFWGLSADIIGRRIAFNSTLLIAAIMALAASASPNWVVLGAFVSFVGFAVGGNSVLDPAVLLEFLPSKNKGCLIMMASWWGVGQAVVGFIAWGYFSRRDWSCISLTDGAGTGCPWRENMAWRLVLLTGGSLILIMSLTRILAVNLKDTPNYLLRVGRDEAVVSELQALAKKYSRPCSLKVQQLEACGSIEGEKEDKSSNSVSKALLYHLKGLFATRKLALLTCLVWLSWAAVGIAYPLFFISLPSLLSSRVKDSVSFQNTIWQNYTLTSFCAILGPVIAFWLAKLKWLGRRYTMTLGALLTGVLFCGYTAIHTSAQNTGLSSSISVCINIYYGTLYAYSIGVFPPAHRATGNGIAIAIVCLMAVVSAVVAQTSDTTTTTPLFVSAGLFFVLAILAACFPFETCDDDTS